jgi:translocation protein SEC63
VARTSDEKIKATELRKKSRGLRALDSVFWINLAVTLALTLFCALLASSISAGGEVSSFDPFHILDIAADADLKAIKKAYKKMSLKWHPDKNPNNPVAEAKFMLIAKAYEALTDPVAKENYAKYGNPDGKQSLEVSIGLPSFLLQPTNKNLVLISYLIAMVGIIPLCVWIYYSRSSKFGDKDIMYDTYSWYHQTIDEHTVVNALPECYAGSAEFRQRNMPNSTQETQEISSLMNPLRTHMQKPKFQHPICIKGNVLLHAHLCRLTASLSPKLKEDLNFMLSRSGPLVDAMVSVCQHQQALKAALACIRFGQYLTQAIWVKDSNLLQLPHFTDAEVAHVHKGKHPVKDIRKYMELPDEQKKGLADFSEQQKMDVLKCCSILPNVTIQTKIFVDDDEDDKVYEGDLCTIRVMITRLHVAPGKKADLVHAPHFPFPRQEAWWVILGTKDGRILEAKKIINQEREIQHDIKFMTPREGHYEFDLFVLSNSYIGLDHQLSVTLDALDSSNLPEYKMHPDDADLDNEPTLFEEMLNAKNVEDDSDDEDGGDEDEDEDDNDNEERESIKELTAQERKKAELQAKRRKAMKDEDEDDDEDDDSVEEIYQE